MFEGERTAKVDRETKRTKYYIYLLTLLVFLAFDYAGRAR